MSDTCAAITAHRDRFARKLNCRALQLRLSGYSAQVHRAALPPVARTVHAAQARVAERAMLAQGRRRCGATSVLRELRASGVRVATMSVALIGREDGLVAHRPTPFVCTTDSRHADPIEENQLARRFGLNDCLQLDRVRVGDMTYIPTHAGRLYLVKLLDLASRRVVSWALGTGLATVLWLTALRRMLAWRPPA